MTKPICDPWYKIAVIRSAEHESADRIQHLIWETCANQGMPTSFVETLANAIDQFRLESAADYQASLKELKGK